MDVLKFIAIGLGILFIIMVVLMVILTTFITIATRNSPDICIDCGGEELGECHKCSVYKRKMELEEKNKRLTDQ